MFLSQAAISLRQTFAGLAPRLQGNVFAAQGVDRRDPPGTGGDGKKTVDDYPARFVADFFQRSAGVTRSEMQYGEFDRGLMTWKLPVRTDNDGVQLRDMWQLGSGRVEPKHVSATFWANNTTDGQKPDYFHAILRPQGVAAYRNGHGTYIYSNLNANAWATSASVFLAREDDLRRAVGNPGSMLEIAARTYAIQFGRDVRPNVHQEGANVFVAEGPKGKVYIENMGYQQGDDLLAVVYSNIDNRNGNRPYVPGLVPLTNDNDQADFDTPAEFAKAVGQNGQWIFDYIARYSLGGVDVAVPRMYAKLDDIVVRATGGNPG
jgi:hypothetical protein